MVIGLVNGAPVPLHLVRESAANQGMRLFALAAEPGRRARPTAATPMASVQGENARGHRGRQQPSTSAARPRALGYDTPVPGVVQADAGRPGQFHLQQRRRSASCPRRGANAALELGVRH